MMFWMAYGSASGGLVPQRVLAACVGCNKASNRIWRRQGGCCFLINVDLLAERGSPPVALENNLRLRPFCGSWLSSGMFLAFLFGAFGAIVAEVLKLSAGNNGTTCRKSDSLRC